MRLIAVLLMVLFGALSVFAVDASNWEAGRVAVANKTTGTNYSSSFNLSKYDAGNIVVTIQVKDTAASHSVFSGDSVAFIWGYQVFNFCTDTAGAVDTCFYAPVSVDSVTAAKYGTMTVRALSTAGLETDVAGIIDTLGCRGFATQSRQLVTPRMGQFMRIWITGAALNRKGKNIMTYVTVGRRPFQPVFTTNGIFK